MRNEAFWTWFEGEAFPKLGARAVTFRLMFEHLDKYDRPVVIVETGCCRRDPAIDESWRLDGCSTVLFDKYIGHRDDGSRAVSVDISRAAVEACRLHVALTLVIEGDSVKFLKSLEWNVPREEIDLLYLDSFDFEPHDPLPSQMHHHAELMAAMSFIRPDTLVVVDDSPAFIDDYQRAEIGGKGFLVGRHMQAAGAELKFWSFHSGWTNVGPSKAPGPEDLKKLVLRGRAHVEADRTVEAEQIYRLILGITTPPLTSMERVAHGEACFVYATLALAKQKIGCAHDWYREAIKADPHAVDYRIKMARQCLIPMGAYEAALAEVERASDLDPSYNEVWHLLGNIHHDMGNTRECVAAFDQQITLDPNDPSSLLDRCTIALNMSDYDLARSLCARVMGTKREPDAWHCLAMADAHQHKHEEAIEKFKRAIEMDCMDKNVTWWNMSISLHAIGRYAEGWEAHERRMGTRNNPVLYLPMTRFTLPRWDGEDPYSKGGKSVKLHVHTEAGSGDNIALLRYLPILRDMGYDVRFEALESMVELVRRSVPGIEVIPRAVDYPGTIGVDLFDYHSPIGSVPAVLGTDIDTVPQNVPYIVPDPELVQHYAGLLHDFNGGRKKIGLCWSSGIRPGVWMREYGLRKSMHFETLAPLTRDFRGEKGRPFFVSLQVGPERSQQVKSLITDVLPAKPTWDDTAALVANLDLVITVDTAIAHLAGAMGKEVWVMAQRDAGSWHFLCWREGASWNERNPWYPTARVFRQATFDQPHKWGDVVADVAKALRKFCAKAPLPVA